MKRILLGLSPLALSLVSLSLTGSCADLDNAPGSSDDDPPLSTEAEVRNPDKSPIPDDTKADEIFPATMDLSREQSPVKSQGSRGVCSIFATTAQAENLYKKAGMQNPDFSEQFLQWSVKNEVGAFRNTSGSTGGDNLRSIVRFGTIDEVKWPYETQPWNTTNDPECTGGENGPTRCWTNGEAPATALAAERRKLPSSRWINTASIKSHLINKKTGVVVGFTFFYQSWNHRRSELPTNSDYWNKGYVTYPNAADKEKSLVKRAGHAILIVGWDDNLEVAMRDGDGNPVLDAQGQPKKEKGFWLFKNSWGTTGFGINHPAGPGYGWLSMRYVQEFGDGVIAEIPSLGPTAEVCDDASRVDEDGDGKINCADSDCAAHPSCSSATVKTFSASPAAAIPDNNALGVTSTITVADAGVVGSAKLTVDITHTFRGDLKVTLSHAGVSPVVFNRTGGSADNLKASFDVPTFNGKTLSGPWTIKVSDAAASDVGKLNSWKLEVTTR
jgi:hypothetical protein